jgi:hypothetical protein
VGEGDAVDGVDVVAGGFRDGKDAAGAFGGGPDEEAPGEEVGGLEELGVAVVLEVVDDGDVGGGGEEGGGEAGVEEDVDALELARRLRR